MILLFSGKNKFKLNYIYNLNSPLTIPAVIEGTHLPVVGFEGAFFASSASYWDSKAHSSPRIASRSTSWLSGTTNRHSVEPLYREYNIVLLPTTSHIVKSSQQ